MNHFHDIAPDNASRRTFLKRSAALSLAGGAAPWALNLAAIGEAAAQSASDYKAIVCVFLYGGNDYANTVVPYDQASYDAYRALRPNVALDRAALTATALNPTTALPGGRQYALAPNLAPLVPLFDAGKLSVMLNIGTLVQPTTKAQYSARSVPLPPKLFSHNDQQSYWQSSLPEGARTGWGGRIGDLFGSANGNSTFTCISVSGNAVYLSGQNAVQYQVGSGGAIAVAGVKNALFGSTACSTALRNLITQPRAHLFENDYAAVTRRSVESNDQLTSALANANLATTFPTGNNLADQLKLVARLISARGALGTKRQVFFVSVGGFDNHDGLASAHPQLMATVGNALAAFYQATVDLGVANSVTTFTASDFGRTLVSNNDGSDHGWGGMHFVLGGAVRGKSFVGTPPAIANNGPDDVGQGRLLPTLAVEQLGASLAGWFGASASDQVTVMPNLANFSNRDLGLFA
jgi:uncharacterized protein (DUF1501 family)